MQPRILVLNGPGYAVSSDYEDNSAGPTLEDIRQECTVLCRKLDVQLDFRQTENEEDLAGWIAGDGRNFDGVVISPMRHARAATAMSAAYHSAIQAVARLQKPVVEVHIHNIFAGSAGITPPGDEPGGDTGLVCGLGLQGYGLAIRAIARRLKNHGTGGVQNGLRN